MLGNTHPPRKRFFLMRRAAMFLAFAVLFGSTNIAALPFDAIGLGTIATIFNTQQASAAATVIVITSTASTTWTVPSDWNSASNTIEVIGGGGAAGDGAPGGASAGAGGGGGGGGAYAKIANASLTPGAIVGLSIGIGGATSTGGGNSYVCNSTSNCASLSGTAVIVGAAGGGASSGTTSGVGGSTVVGSTTASGGGGATGSGSHGANGGAGAGGGGAAGCGASTCVAGSPGANGVTPTAQTGGGGDSTFGGSGGVSGSNGGSGLEWGSYGSGGGGGGGAGVGNGVNGGPGGNGGNYGGGGGGGAGGGKGATTGGAGGSGIQGLIVITYNPLPTTYTQSAYEWYANTDSALVGSPLASQNSTATITLVSGQNFRLRMLARVGSNPLASGVGSFNLQYVDEGTGSCTSPSGGSPNSYTNVATSTGLIHFYNNPTPADGIALTATSTDPIDGTSTIVNQTYDESNPVSNSQGAIAVGQDGKWDFSLVTNNVQIGETYCFRMVKSDGTVFASYAFYPQVVVGDVAPTVGTVTLNGNASITLTVGTTTPIQASATVSDANGNIDLAGTTARIFRTSLGPNCTLDNNNCYQTTNCSLSSCFSTSCVTTCTANISYYAQPTDSGTPWTGDSWSASIQQSDNEGATSTIATSTGVSLLSLLGLQVASSINYGSFLAGGSMASLTASLAVLNVGNVSLNTTLYGTNMTSGANSIPVGNQHYATSVLSFASGTPLLANPGTTIALAIPKTTSSVPASATLDWGISIPSLQPTGSFTGGNTFVAVENSLPWP